VQGESLTSGGRLRTEVSPANRGWRLSVSGGGANELGSVDYSRSIGPACFCRSWPWRRMGFEKEVEAQSCSHRLGRTARGSALRATTLARSSTTNLTALRHALAALMLAERVIERSTPPSPLPAVFDAGVV
jgi:hypothetical protein